jgi:hypothetical protein
MSALEKLIVAFYSKDYSALTKHDISKLVRQKLLCAETAAKIARGILP